MNRPMSKEAVEHALTAPIRDLGAGFKVRRALPVAECRMVGPFVFFDQFGPTAFAAGAGLDVRPHPHIGLATVTYLFDGEILHRDSLGNAQIIRPGEVNWMIAGKGIVHSERTAASLRSGTSSLSGIQTWVALPQLHEDSPASFAHHAADALPRIERPGQRICLIAGSLFGERSPVAALSAMGYADAALESGTLLHFAAEYEQRAVFVVQGSVEAHGRCFQAGQLLVLRAHEPLALRAVASARVMLFGGEPLDGPRFVWWNFVASSQARIEQAKADWRAGRFAAVPGDEREFIPLPGEATGEAPGTAPSAAADNSIIL